MAKNLKVGEIVYLNSGSPKMTVVAIGFNKLKIKCDWMDKDGKHYTQIFHSATLTR